MCIADSHILLCTCATVDPEADNIWTLHRRTHEPNPAQDWELMIVGSFAAPSPMSVYVNAKVLNDLNRFPVFDFAYTPNEGDRLSITFGGENLTYFWDDGFWKDHHNQDQRAYDKASDLGYVSMARR